MENFYKSVEDLSRYYAFNFGIVHNDIKLPNIHVLPDYQYHGPTEDYSRPQGIDYVDWGRWLRVEQGNGPEADRVVSTPTDTMCELQADLFIGKRSLSNYIARLGQCTRYLWRCSVHVVRPARTTVAEYIKFMPFSTFKLTLNSRS
jgi:hypothetical protein